MSNEINEIVVADKANEIGEIIAANEATVNEAVLTNEADKTNKADEAYGVSVAKMVIDANEAIILFNEALELASKAVHATEVTLAKKSDSALLISPFEIDATKNFEDLSQKIAVTAFAPPETVIGTACAPSQFRITIESTTNWNLLVEWDISVCWRSLILTMRPMGPTLFRPTRALWPKRS